MDFIAPFSLISTSTSIVFQLTKKDFVEVLYYQRQLQQQEWQKFLSKIPLIKAMPYFLIQSMSTILFQQVYTANEVVYDVGDSNCDHLYFVFGGKLKVEAVVEIIQEVRFPIANA